MGSNMPHTGVEAEISQHLDSNEKAEAAYLL